MFGGNIDFVVQLILKIHHGGWVLRNYLPCQNVALQQKGIHTKCDKKLVHLLLN